MAYIPFSEMSNSRAQIGLKRHPRRRGQWIECVEDLQIVQYRDGSKPLGKALNLPSTPILDEYHDTGNLPIVDDRMETRPPETQACPIVGLPAEILVQIAKHIIPTGQIYHVFQTSSKEQNFAIINTMSKPFTSSATQPSEEESNFKAIHLNLTALASTCKRLSDVYHSVFYGENDFVFSRVINSGDPKLHLETELAIESWCRVHQQSAEDGALWPLTESMLNRHVKRLSFAVSAPCRSNSGDHTWFREELRKMLAFLGPSCSIKRLEVDISDISRSSRARSSNNEDPLSVYIDDLGRLRLVARQPCSLDLPVLGFAEQAMHSAGVDVIEQVLLNGRVLHKGRDDTI